MDSKEKNTRLIKKMIEKTNERRNNPISLIELTIRFNFANLGFDC